MNVLVACECSQTVCAAFREKGHHAFSCDIEKEYGKHPEWHIQCDVSYVLNGNINFRTNDGAFHSVDHWDLIIAHPPCTYLCNCQAPLYNVERFGKEKVELRRVCQKKAIEFFMKFVNLKFVNPHTKVCIENPVGIMSRIYKKTRSNNTTLSIRRKCHKKNMFLAERVTPS